MPPRETRDEDERAGLLARDVERGGGGATTSGARVDDEEASCRRAKAALAEAKAAVVATRRELMVDALLPSKRTIQDAKLLLMLREAPPGARLERKICAWRRAV